MATGVFNTARGHGQLLQHRKRVERQRRLDRFADALAEHDAEAGDPGGVVWKAAERIGLTAKEGASLLQIIRRGLGPQAR